MTGRTGTESPRREFAFRLVATAALVVGLVAVWHLASFVFLVFGAILFAIFLHAPASWVSGRSRIPYWLSLTCVVLLFFGALVGLGWMFAPAVSSQFNEISQQLPQSIAQIRQRLEQYTWIETLMEDAPQPNELLSGEFGIFSRFSRLIVGTLDVITGLVIVIFAGIFLAASPQVYVNGVLHLVPQRRRDAAAEVLAEVGKTLRNWLIGQFIAMVVVGLVTWGGLALMGVRLAVGLGVLAGFLEFIPTFGPILAAIPAILIALLDGPEKALWVTLLYVGIQSAESHLLTPLVQRRAVKLPPALSIFALLLMGTLFGFLGLLLAIPMTAALFVIVKETYVKRTLKDPINDE